MPIPHFEVPGGVVNGVNTVFTTALPYTAGSVAVFINGQLKRLHVPTVLDGWTETNPATGDVTLDEAPLVGDVVQIFYLDRNPLPLVVTDEVQDLEGFIEDVEIDGTITCAC